MNSLQGSAVNPGLVNLDVLNIQKMVFIYNAVLAGWTVRMMEGDKFEFRKNKDDVAEFDLEDFLKNFIRSNLNVENIIKDAANRRAQ